VRTSNTILGDALAVCEGLKGAKVIELLVVDLSVPDLSLRQSATTCLKLLLCPSLHILKGDPGLELAKLPWSDAHR